MQKTLEWRYFAEQLTELAKSEGQTHFLTRAFSFLNDYVTVDSCSVFKIAADKTSGAEHLCTFGTLPNELALNLAQDYIKNGFRADPMVQTALLSSHARVRQLPDSHYSDAYRSQYFEKAGLIDKISSIHSSKNVLFLVSFYRAKANGFFSTENFKDLERLAPIIGRFVLRHVNLSTDRDIKTGYNREKVSQLVDDSTQVFAKLSGREKEVCKNILLGEEDKDIAARMEVSLNTVVTYRRRIYTKLNIGSRSELFHLALISQI